MEDRDNIWIFGADKNMLGQLEFHAGVGAAALHGCFVRAALHRPSVGVSWWLLCVFNRERKKEKESGTTVRAARHR